MPTEQDPEPSPLTSIDTQDTGEDLEPLLTNQQNQLNLTFNDGYSIDGKALAILGANIAIIIFVQQATGALPDWQYVVLYGPFLISLLLDVASIWPRRYKGPGITQLSAYINMPRGQMLLKLLSNTQAAILHNARLNTGRMRLSLWSIGITGFGFLMILLIL